MRSALTSLMIVITLAALICGAVLGRFSVNGRFASIAGSRASQSASSSNDATVAATDPIPAEPVSGNVQASSSVGQLESGCCNPADPVQEFRDWFERVLGSSQDRQVLRSELKSALARLSDETEVGSGDDAAAYDSLRRTEQFAGSDYTRIMDEAERFLENYPNSELAADARGLFDRAAHSRDEHDFELARQFSRDNPDRFEVRIKRYQEYLDAHAASGGFAADARRAIESIRMDWSEHDYRSIFEFWRTYPNDIAAVAVRLRRFEESHPASSRRAAVEQFLARYEKASAPGDYRIRVKSGSFDRSIGHLVSFGPDLAVDIEVAGVRLGRTPIVADSFEPAWEYEFPQMVRWRIGDPVKIRVMDFDYSNRTILKIDSGDDPLALRYLNGTSVSNGHRLTIECNFEIPTLPAP